MLKINNINVSYGKKQILFDTSLSVDEHEKLLLIGPNGAGKTTLLRAIGGLLRLDSGDIEFNDNNISLWSTRQRINAGIGYLLQTENIVPGLTVDENLNLGGYSLKKQAANERIDTIVEIFTFLKMKLNIRAGLLSGGERQALAIGMVLMKKPHILLLDEPSAGLAPKAAKDIIGQIKKLQSAMDIKAVCMVEHNLKLALEWASRVVVLVAGNVAHVSVNPVEYLNKPHEIEKFFFG